MMSLFGRGQLKALAILASLCCLQASVMAAVISQGYQSQGEISAGMLVSLNDAGKVEASTESNVNDLFGVAVEADSAAVSVTSGNDDETQVATSGLAAALVSDINGEVKKGDAITVSPIAGVGMKVGDDVNQKIIGIAQEDPKDGVSQKVNTSDGEREIKISRVPVQVSVSFFSAKTNPLTYIQQAGTTVAGKPISTTKALLAGLILLVSILSVSVLLYTAIRSSLISIGRNPLSEGAVRQELLRVLLVAPLILGAALGLIYAILRG